MRQLPRAADRYGAVLPRSSWLPRLKPPDEVCDHLQNMLFHGLLGDAVERGNVLLLHVLQAKENEDIPGAFGELVKRPEHFLQRLVPFKDALGPAILHAIA